MTDVTGKRVLFAEDEPLVAMALEDIILDLGCELVGPAHTLERLLALIESERIDAAILDINLHGERSFAAAGRLVEKGVPYAFATGYSSDAFGLPNSDAPLLEKPYRREQIETVLRRMLT